MIAAIRYPSVDEFTNLTNLNAFLQNSPVWGYREALLDNLAMVPHGQKKHTGLGQVSKTYTRF